MSTRWAAEVLSASDRSGLSVVPRKGKGWAFETTFSLALVSALSLLTGFTWADAWSAADKAVLASMSLDKLPPPPRDVSNAVEAVPAAVALGNRLFGEVRFSRNHAVSCRRTQ